MQMQAHIGLLYFVTEKGIVRAGYGNHSIKGKGIVRAGYDNHSKNKMDF